LEEALWDLLREADPTPPPAPAEKIDDNIYRLIVLSILLETDDPELVPLQRYLQLQGSLLHPRPLSPGGERGELSRLSCRRAWHLADRLGARIRDYEYERQDSLIQRWLIEQAGEVGANVHHQAMERAQPAVFR